MGRTLRIIGVLTFGALMGSKLGLAQDVNVPLAVPVDPVEAIVSAFESHQIVALEVNGYEEGHEVRASLVQHPRFAALVDDVFVQFGASRYQKLMDQFGNGEGIPLDALKDVWLQTTQPHHVYDIPINEEFLYLVRDVNSRVAENRKIRVLLAEPPIDWEVIEDFEDLLPWLQSRLRFEGTRLQEEVLAKNRKALLLFASGHFLNGLPMMRAIEDAGASLYRIWTVTEKDLAELQPNVRDWPVPSLAEIKNTTIGVAALSFVNREWGGTVQDQYEAVLYLGPPSSLTESKIDPDLCVDQEYLDLRVPRLEMAARNGAPDFLEEFTTYCESARSLEN